MRNFFYPLLLILFSAASLNAQTVIVSGECISGSITLNPIGDIDGKPAYENTGTVDGNPGVQIDVYWIPSPDNLWVLAFDGQPYFQNSCTTSTPPPTGGACSWDAVSGQTCTGSNPLVVAGTGTLAVKITSFSARQNNGVVVLNWQTANEINNKGFEIQRSANGISWNKIGFVNGNINSSIPKNYVFDDVNPLSGKNLYRLRQVDIDNKETYSAIVSVNILKSGFYSVSNNPGNGLYKLYIETTSEKINFSVIDANGRKIISKIYDGSGDQTIDLTKYSSGIYLLQIQKGTSLFTDRLIKL